MTIGKQSPYRTFSDGRQVCGLWPLGCYWLYFRWQGISLTLWCLGTKLHTDRLFPLIAAGGSIKGQLTGSEKCPFLWSYNAGRVNSSFKHLALCIVLFRQNKVFLCCGKLHCSPRWYLVLPLFFTQASNVPTILCFQQNSALNNS